MYKIDINSLLINWEVLYYGIKNDIISPKASIDYASVYLEKNQYEDNSDIIDLLILEDFQKDKVLKLLKRIKQISTSDFFCKKVLRYLILDTARNSLFDTNALLEFAEEVYADFDYPEDMNSFIKYMPVSDDYNPSLHTEEENLKHLCHNFDKFMANELLWITENQIWKIYIQS